MLAHPLILIPIQTTRRNCADSIVNALTYTPSLIIPLFLSFKTHSFPTKFQHHQKNRKNKNNNNKKKKMKLVWSPEIASKAYLDTVKSCENFQESSVAELVSAMAAGWNAKLMVETWSRGGVTTTSIGLAIASRHTCGRHVCIVPDLLSRSEYVEGMEKAGMSPEVIVGEPEEAFRELAGIDFLLVNCKNDDFTRILRVAKLGQRGAVLVCKNASGSKSEFRWRGVVDGGSRLVRTVILPVGKGLDIAHVGAGGGAKGSGSGRKGESRWIKHIDRQSGEEFLIRR